jgi:hypothetical protein
MTYWLDYFAARLTGATIKAAGYPGVIRYVGAGSTGKRTDANEYRSHLAAGLTVLLVCQGTTKDVDRGFAGGVDMAKAALADAKVRAPGYSGPFFFTNDRPELPSPANLRAYLDGAASVLGKSRVGAYGFRNAMDAAIGHATYFWQAGRRSDVWEDANGVPRVHLWQDNNTQVRVGGITCDRNLILKTITTEDDDMQLNDSLAPVKLSDQQEHTLTVGDVLQGMAQYIAGQSKAVAGKNTTHPAGQYVGRIVSIAGIKDQVTAQGAAIQALAGLLAKQAGGESFTLAQVGDEVEGRVAKALRENTVHVDIDVTGDDD